MVEYPNQSQHNQGQEEMEHRVERLKQWVPRRDMVSPLQEDRPHELQQDVVRRQSGEQRPQRHPEDGCVGGRVPRVDPGRLQEEEERALLHVGIFWECRQFRALLVEEEDLQQYHCNLMHITNHIHNNTYRWFETRFISF